MLKIVSFFLLTSLSFQVFATAFDNLKPGSKVVLRTDLQIGTGADWSEVMINNSVATEVFFEPSAVASCLERPPKYIKKDCVYCQIDVSRTLWKQLGGYWRKGTELTLSKPTSGVGSMFVKQIDHDGKRITIKRNQPVIKCNVAYDAYMSYDYEVLSYKSRAATTDEIFGKMYNVIGVLPVPKQ